MVIHVKMPQPTIVRILTFLSMINLCSVVLIIKQEISLKKIFGCISIVKFVLGLYVLLFVTQGHPTWESIIDTVTIQILL